MNNKAAFIYDSSELEYRFHESHPFNQRRLLLTHELLFHIQALSSTDFIKPRQLDEQTLLSVHTSEYVSMVKALSTPTPSVNAISSAEQYGLGLGDTPFFNGMHEATLATVAGSVTAVDLVMSGEYKHAIHLAGGLHHAFRNKAAGFCVYNDASVAIAHIQEKYGARVLYIDTDVHHGDGVQETFYTDAHVCTFSIHETGKYLFPGTGYAADRGHGDGFGYSFNLPMEPYTEDQSWLDCFHEAIHKVAAFFKPDIIVSQHGCDAHYYDPLSHQQCSMNIYLEMPKIIQTLADTWCNGKWVALGGGGYDIWRVVPRAWSLLWLTMSNHPLVDKLRTHPTEFLPEQWRTQVQVDSPTELPLTWLDDTTAWEAVPRLKEISEKNLQTKDLSLLYLPT
ncbi:MAG: acetoin utilization protein AcuC [Paenibacillaceae bacterium]